MRLTLLGTGDARQVPVYGCDCPACRNARADAGLRRRPCSALLECAGQRWLIDSGLVDLCERFPPHSLDGILQTHYHADHAQGLLHLRWGQGLVIPVHGPADPEGLADLYKHPGILDFSQPLVDLHWDAIAKAVGAPAHGERRGPLEGVELRRSHRLGVLPHRFRGARDHPPHDTAAAQRQGLARGLQQAVLARAGRPHQINQSACHQNTLCPPRQT